MPRRMFGRLRSSRKSLLTGTATPEAPPVNRRSQVSSRSRKSKSSSVDSSLESVATEDSTTSTHPTISLGFRKKRQSRRTSFGDASVSSLDSSAGVRTSQTRSARYHNSRNSSRRERPQDTLEEEKKEILSEGEVEDEDDFFKSPEFRNRVAHEAADLDKEGNTYFETGDYDQAFMSYEKALKLKRASLRVDKKSRHQNLLTETESQKASILASVATSINNMTYLRQRAGQASADETMAAYLKSLQIKREILGPNHLSVGKTLNNIGSVFYLKKEYVPALKAYENALDIMSEQLGDKHLDVGTVLSNIGDVHSAMLHKWKALEFYRKALDIRWIQLGRNDPKVVRLMEQTASLETGKQPRKQVESDSEGEEFAEEDRERRRVFREECNALQQELAEDIRFFDLVERTLAIELVQQKTKFIRTIRSMGKTADEVRKTESMMDFVDEDDLSETSSISIRSAPPDLDDKPKEEAPEVIAFLKEIGAEVSGRRPKQKRVLSKGRPETPVNAETVVKPVTPPTASTEATGGSNDDSSFDRPRNRDDDGADQLSQNQRFWNHKHRAFLTPEERRLALVSVQERVATLKSKRELEIEMEGLDPTEARRKDLVHLKRQVYLDSARGKKDIVHLKRQMYLDSVRKKTAPNASPPVK